MKKLLDIKETSEGLFNWLKGKDLRLIQTKIGNIKRFDFENIGQKNTTIKKITYRKYETNEYLHTVRIDGIKSGMEFCLTFNLSDAIDYCTNENECCLTLNDGRKIHIRI